MTKKTTAPAADTAKAEAKVSAAVLPRKSFKDIQPLISNEYCFVVNQNMGDGVVGAAVVVVLLLASGINVLGTSAFVATTDFDPEVARTAARDDAVQNFDGLTKFTTDDGGQVRRVLTQADADADLAGTPRPV